MIDKTPIPGLNITNDVAKTQINNFWNYLNDLSQNNPDEYKKFIQNQFKKGIEMYAPKNLNKDVNQTNIIPKAAYEVHSYICLRFKLIKILNDISDNISQDDNKDTILTKDPSNQWQLSEAPLITFSYQFESDAFSSKVIQDRKIYLNIVYSDEYYTPTDTEGHFLSGDNLENDNKWGFIPTEFRYNGKKDSFTGIRCDFYDMIISKFVVDKMSNDKGLYKAVLSYAVRKFIIFLNLFTYICK